MAGTVSAVFVDGFDFGTTEQDLEAHMGKAGTVQSIEMKRGSAVVTFSTAAEAQHSVSSLNKSTIPGNSRYIFVQLDKKSLPPWAGAGTKRSFGGDSNSEGGSKKVLIRGFDFETTDEQIWEHMGKVGTVLEIYWVSKGSVNVIYSSASEATAAIQQLDRSTIDGNSRFIDVVPGGDRFSGGKKFRGETWGGSGADGDWVFIPSGGKGGGGKGKGGKGKGGGGGKFADHSDEDPAGSGRVFVRGFDFGTSDEQLEGHMSTAGRIHTVHWVNKGNAVVVYKSKASVAKAISMLDNTTIPGNTRYIHVNERH